jgi:UDP-N-acetylmuramoyl-tripeptide--D-alanyl-D-alanine ligase
VHDGHDFVEAALKAGAAFAVVEGAARQVSRRWRLLVVDDVLAALELGIASRAPSEGADHRDHRLGRQDLDQGSAAPRAVAQGKTHASVAVLQQSLGRAADAGALPADVRYASSRSA